MSRTRDAGASLTLFDATKTAAKQLNMEEKRVQRRNSRAMHSLHAVNRVSVSTGWFPFSKGNQRLLFVSFPLVNVTAAVRTSKRSPRGTLDTAVPAVVLVLGERSAMFFLKTRFDLLRSIFFFSVLLVVTSCDD